MSKERSKEICKALSESGAYFSPYSRNPINGASVVLRRLGNKEIVQQNQTLFD